MTVLLLLGVLTPAQGSDVVGRSADGVFTFEGRGFGHGRGLSQYGAYGAALQGLTYAQILDFYYSGTTLGTAPSVQRRVLLTAEDADAVLTNVPGLRIRDVARGVVLSTGDRADWSQVRARPDGTVLRVEALQSGSWVAVLPAASGSVVFEGPPVLSLHHPAGLRTYRGTLNAALSGQPGKPLYVVNTVGLDDYVRGVVPAEMPSSWHPEALKAQSVAARSYGVQACPQGTAYPATALYDVVDTTSCQVYGGVGSERASTNQAVASTAGQVVRYGDAVLRTEFSASNGGWTVANGGAYVAREDPYDAIGAQAARSTVNRWTGVRVPAASLERAFATGILREIQVLSRDGRGEWGGRVLRVRLVGDSRTVEISGDQLRSAAGLRSRWFNLVSPIDVKHAELGGDAGPLGPASIAETGLVGGRYRHYRSGSIYWSPATGAQDVRGAIRDTWARLGWETGGLGYPVTGDAMTGDGRGWYNHFQGGTIIYSGVTGAQDVRGAIRSHWSALGSENGGLGYPVTGDAMTGDGRGWYNHFQGGTVLYTGATGAQNVRGAIRSHWSALGSESGPLGYPVTSDAMTGDGRGWYNHFQGGTIIFSAASGAQDVRGSIRGRWAALGSERGPLGYPVTSDARTGDGMGWYNHFQGGTIIHSAASGTHEVRGAIRNRWASLGSERGSLGYPVSDEYDVPGGKRSDFQRGSITWDARTGATTIL